MLRRLRHAHVIRYFHSFVEADNFYMVMEYAEGGDMYNVRTISLLASQENEISK